MGKDLELYSTDSHFGDVEAGDAGWIESHRCAFHGPRSLDQIGRSTVHQQVSRFFLYPDEKEKTEIRDSVLPDLYLKIGGDGRWQ